MAPVQGKRKSLSEAFALTRLPTHSDSSPARYISHTPAWKLGVDLPYDPSSLGPGAFGGVVYAQAALSAAREIELEEARADPTRERRKMGIHSIQGVFTKPANVDRPFIHEITPIQTAYSFAARFVTSRHTAIPSNIPEGPFPTSDAELPLDEPCFSCLTTFKRSRDTIKDFQAVQSPQEMYKDILSQRAPDEWEPCPIMDIDLVVKEFGNMGHGSFPVLDMHKVDMRPFNEGRPYAEIRQLLLYRPHKPIDKNDPNAHVVAHAFASDRNGLIMLGNHVGDNHDKGGAATLSYSFFVHVNAEDAIMDDSGWWVQENRWTRLTAGRCTMETRTWSPEGVHVATGIQDGTLTPKLKTRGRL